MYKNIVIEGSKSKHKTLYIIRNFLYFGGPTLVSSLSSTGVPSTFVSNDKNNKNYWITQI